MRSANYKAEIAPNGQIAVPPEIAFQVPLGEPIQVLLQVGDLRGRQRLAPTWAEAVRSGIRNRRLGL
jgi:hypothetical protein